MELNNKYFAHGKLLITGEYAVLDGAKAIAIPTKLGQWLEVAKNPIEDSLHWISMDVNNEVWYECLLSPDLKTIHTTDKEKTNRLLELLQEAIAQNPLFSEKLKGTTVTTKLEFDRNWGLGSSSTLIQLLSEWAQINPFTLLKDSFTGSGYDVACAKANSPISYQLINGKPMYQPIPFAPSFSNQFYLIYLGNKQFSDKEIAKYAQLNFKREELSFQISEISNQLISCSSITDFSRLIEKHEDLLSSVLNYPKVKDQFFSSITGTFKSLGAWGGDFCLFIGSETELPNIKKLGFDTIIKWDDLLKI